MSDEKDTLDRAWNFLSDLGPLLNLFGEGVTTQFLRGSLFLEDHILLATLPIGIVTIIVSAIRVAGPMWLKAIIGRAGESRGTVELQLMSSTSQFVSELWDGMTMVRVLAKAPIYEILYLDANPDADPDADKPADKLADNPVDKRNFYRLREAENDSIMLRKLAPRSLLWHWIRSTLLGRRKEYIKVPPKAASGLDPYQSSTPGENCSPTVILNIGNAAGGNGLLIAVGLGLLFQIGVLIIIGFSSYNSRTAQLFNIHDTPPRYVTIAAIVGTVTVSAGVLICSIVIDSRTQEFVHRLNPDTHAKHIFQLFWLQKGGAVNDQEFGSYAIFPRYQLDRIISSGPLDHNVKKGNSVINDHEMMNPLGEEQASTIARFSATVGSFLTLSGFILQVLGLRGMPLAAPLSIQCGTLLLLGLRATVRRRRTTRPYIVVLPVNFELEKLALDFTRAGGPISLWLEMKERSTSRLWNLKERLKQRDEEDQQQAHSHRKLQSIFIAAAQLKHQNPMDWKPDGTIMERNPNGLFKIRGSDGKSSLWVVNDIRCPQKWDVDQTITRAVDMRMELGRVTRLSSAARQNVTTRIP
ncbi:hypothetical protein BDZ91DRAFT_91876 [Kalaharituber pfeilii]|nr:hypothetical protein BDZ91DRAFT_91876 [Kalaharituber pfeilii]